MWIKVSALWKLYEAGALKGFLGSSHYYLKKEDRDAIPDDLKNELNKLAKKYEKYKGKPKKILYKLTRYHMDLIVKASEQSNMPLNKMMGLAAVYLSEL